MNKKRSNHLIILTLLALFNIIIIVSGFWYIQNIRFYGKFKVIVNNKSNNISSDFECYGITFTGKRVQIPIVDSCFVFNDKWYFKSLELTNKNNRTDELEILFVSNQNIILARLLSSKVNIIELKDNYIDGDFFYKLINSGLLISNYARITYFIILVCAAIIVIFSLFFLQKELL